MSRINVSWVAVLVLAGCSFNEGGVSFDDGGGGGDAPQGIDAASGTPDAQDPGTPDARVPDAIPPDAACPGDVLPFVPSNIGRCGMPEPGAGIALADGTWEFDTDTGELYNAEVTLVPPSALVPQSGGPELRVVSVNSWGQIGDLFVVGSRPLVIVSFGNVSLDGYIILWAEKDVPGPGGGIASLCTTGAGHPGVIQTASLLDAGTGGGGGAFGDAAGGGARVNGTNGDAIAAPGGTANGNAQLVPLRGGCNGGAGGNGGGPGGGGGGAIQIVAAGTISLTNQGRVSARGAGGGAPLPFDNQPASRGGGGGGSGGAVLLEATTITVMAGGVLAAQGGGGGEGTRSGGTETVGGGDDGEPGRSFSAVAAQGGADANCSGGDGGDGAIEGVEPGDGLEGLSDEAFASGSGGGGGSVGRIRLRASTLNLDGAAVISPAYTQ